MIVWLGVDPGADGTGMALLAVGRTVELLDHRVVLNDGDSVGHQYVARVLGAIEQVREGYARATDGLLAAPGRGAIRVAVEKVNSPTGFAAGKRHPINPLWLLGCAVVQGAVMAMHPDAVLVPPGGNGHGCYGAYPEDLVTAAERRRRGWATLRAGQSSDMRHARSAWDCAVRASRSGGGWPT